MADNPASTDGAPARDSGHNTDPSRAKPPPGFFSTQPSPSSYPPTYPPVNPPATSRSRTVGSPYRTAAPPPPFNEPLSPSSDLPQPDTSTEETATQPRLWEKQPYGLLMYLTAIAGTAIGGWFFGILVAQIMPHTVTQVPWPETFLRRSSRLSQQLRHLPRLWHTPTAQTHIAAIPLPETGPVLAPIALSPMERQPLIDELNAVETEIITLDRRLLAIEKRLGKPPHQGTDVESRVNALRAAIDPPPRVIAQPDYVPVPQDPADTLLDVAALKITLPSDALFTPGQAQIKEAALLKPVLDQLVNYPEATLLIRSHSDDQASAADSREYTLAQANALSDYLQASLPSIHRWITIGAGQSTPIASNSDAVTRQQNRRMEILVDTR